MVRVFFQICGAVSSAFHSLQQQQRLDTATHPAHYCHYTLPTSTSPSSPSSSSSSSQLVYNGYTNLPDLHTNRPSLNKCLYTLPPHSAHAPPLAPPTWPSSRDQRERSSPTDC